MSRRGKQRKAATKRNALMNRVTNLTHLIVDKGVIHIGPRNTEEITQNYNAPYIILSNGNRKVYINNYKELGGIDDGFPTRSLRELVEHPEENDKLEFVNLLLEETEVELTKAKLFNFTFADFQTLLKSKLAVIREELGITEKSK